jgi:hypothetical protein
MQPIRAAMKCIHGIEMKKDKKFFYRIDGDGNMGREIQKMLLRSVGFGSSCANTFSDRNANSLKYGL